MKTSSEFPALRIVLTALAMLIGGSARAEIISPERRLEWQGNVGIAGGIPSSSTKTVFITIPAGASLITVQNAINNCPANQVVQLSAGTYSFSSRLEFIGANQGIVLRGTTNTNGAPTTTITFTDAETTCVLITSSSGYAGLSTDANLSQNAVKGQNTLTLASVPSWVEVGDLIGIDQLDEASFVFGGGTEGGGELSRNRRPGSKGHGPNRARHC